MRRRIKHLPDSTLHLTKTPRQRKALFKLTLLVIFILGFVYISFYAAGHVLHRITSTLGVWMTDIRADSSLATGFDTNIKLAQTSISTTPLEFQWARTNPSSINWECESGILLNGRSSLLLNSNDPEMIVLVADLDTIPKRHVSRIQVLVMQIPQYALDSDTVPESTYTKSISLPYTIPTNGVLEVPFITSPAKMNALRIDLLMCLKTSMTAFQTSLIGSKALLGYQQTHYVKQNDCMIISDPIILGSLHKTVVWESTCWGSTGIDQIPFNSTMIHPTHYIHYSILPVDSSTYSLSSKLYKLPKESNTFKFAILSDSQSNAFVFRHLLKHSSGVDQIVHLGDFVQDADRLKEWKTYFMGPLSELGGLMPILIVRGNHDSGHPFVYGYTPNQPDYYTVVWQKGSTSVLIVVLNAYLAKESIDRETTWLREVLDNGQSYSYRLVFCHIPPFIEYWDLSTYSENQQFDFIKSKWVPLFEEMHVNAVFSGHSHIYQRGSLNSVTYVVTGGGGGALETEMASFQQLYKVTIRAHHVLVGELSEQREGQRHGLSFKVSGMEGEELDQWMI